MSAAKRLRSGFLFYLGERPSEQDTGPGGDHLSYTTMMMLFEMMTKKWLSCWRLGKYLKKFTDVQQFAFLLSIQKGPDRMLGFFLEIGVGRNLTIGGMVDWGLTKTDGAKGEAFYKAFIEL